MTTGRQVRRWTALRRATGRTTSVADTVADVYMGVLAAAMALASALYAARDSGLTAADATSAGGVAGLDGRLDAAWLWLLALAVGLVEVVRLARRLGPVGLDAARVRWWLPLPVDRRGLLGPAAWRWPALGALLGACLGAVGAVALGGPSTPASSVLACAALAASVCAAACLALVTAQAGGGRSRPVDLALAVARAVVVGGAVLVLALAPPAPPLPGAAALTVATALAAALAVVSAVAARRALPRVPDGELARGGRVAGAAAGAALMLDTRTLGDLGAGEGASLVRRPLRTRLLARLPARLRAPAALLTADLVATRRRPGAAARPLLAVLAVALVAAARVPDWVLPVAVGVGGYLAATAGASGARVARTDEGLDAHLPMGARAHRVVRLAAAWCVAAPYVLGAALVLAGGRPAPALAWLVLLAAAAIGWAAAALRWAYRKDDHGTGPVAPSPFGPVPIGSIMLLLTGPDLAVVASVTAGLAVWSGAPTAALTAVAVSVSLGLAWAVTRPAQVLSR